MFAALLLAQAATAQEEAPKLKKAPGDARQLFNEAANLQNAKEFELAAEIWEQFLKKYPDTDHTPKAQHYCGVCYLAVNKLDKAALHFEACVTKWANAPEFSYLEDAYANLGSCQFSLAKQAKSDQAKRYEQAAQTFDAQIKKFPKGKYTDDALYFLGESLYWQGKAKQAIAPYTELAEKHKESKRRADGLYALGVTHQELEQFAAAGGVYDTFLTEFAESALAIEVRMRKAETMLQLGIAAAKDGNNAEAKPLFEKALTVFEETTAVEGFAQADYAMTRQGVCLVQLGRNLDAAKTFAKAATDFPNSPYAKGSTLDAGRFFYDAKAYKEAAPWLDKVVKTDPAGAPEAAHWLCRIHLEGNEPKKAADLAGKVLPTAGESSFLVYLKMDQADGKYEIPAEKAESLNLYLKIVQEHPKHDLAGQALYNAAFTALELKKYDDGLTHTASFLESFPTHKLLPDAKYVSGECNLLAGKHAEAAAAYRDLLANHAGHVDFEKWQVRLGFTLYLQKKYADAVAALAPVVDGLKTPVNIAEAQFLIGASQFNEKKHADAAKALSASLKADSKWLKADETLLLLAQSQHELKQTDEAITTIKQFIGAHADSKLIDQAHYRLGQFSYAKGDFKTSIAEYTTVTDKWPDSSFAPFALFGRGWALLETKEYPTAIESFTALLTNHAEHMLAPEAHFGRGQCRRRDGDAKGAISDLDEFLKSKPQKHDVCGALYERGLAQVALKQYPAAADSFGQVLKTDPKCTLAPNTTYELAWALKLDKKEADAVKQFAAIAADFADSEFAAEANFHVADDLYDKEKYDEAAKHYTASKQKAGNGELGEKATYKLGWSNYQLKQFGEALKQFQEQVKTYPAGPLHSDGLFMVAECLFYLDDYEKALPAYEAVRAVVADSEKTSDDVKVLILLHGGQSAGKLNKWDVSLSFLKTIPTDFPNSSLVPEASFEIGQALHGMGGDDPAKYDEALPEFERAYARAAALGQLGLSARARYMVGEVYFAKKQYDDAVKQFIRVMRGFADPSDEVKKWQAYAGYEAARCSHVQIATETNAQKKAKLLADAKQYYTYVVDEHPKSPVADTAKTQLAALNK